MICQSLSPCASYSIKREVLRSSILPLGSDLHLNIFTFENKNNADNLEKHKRTNFIERFTSLFLRLYSRICSHHLNYHYFRQRHEVKKNPSSRYK